KQTAAVARLKPAADVVARLRLQGANAGRPLLALGRRHNELSLRYSKHVHDFDLPSFPQLLPGPGIQAKNAVIVCRAGKHTPGIIDDRTYSPWRRIAALGFQTTTRITKGPSPPARDGVHRHNLARV